MGYRQPKHDPPAAHDRLPGDDTVTQYTTRVEHYGPGGLIDFEDIVFNLTGEDEQRYLSPPRVKSAYATLRQWSLDAQYAVDTWDAKTAGQ
jgi:hypothetical protein